MSNMRRTTTIAGLALLTALGCSRDSLRPVAPMSSEQFPLDPSAAKLVKSEKLDPKHVAGSRKAEENAALAGMLRISAPAVRELILKSLEPESQVAIVSIANPEQKRLYEKISSIRRADHYAKRREESKALARRFGLEVTLAL